MANKKDSSKDSKKSDSDEKKDIKSVADKLSPEIKNEAEKRIEQMKETLDSFSNKVKAKFENYVLGICLLPPDQQPSDENSKKQEQSASALNVLVLIDDSDSKKMSKAELKQRLSKVIDDMAKEVNSAINPDVLILSELWEMCYDGKYDYLNKIARGAIVYDKGMLSAIKIAEVHKTMVLSKFEKYIVSYVLAGSLIQGRATEKSDVDVFVVIDDTDVKRMTRTELKDKLRAIIIGMGYDAGQMTGITNKLNIQVYILTEFWDSLREANPVIFTLLRDGVPFYDRGIFVPWKQLLKMGRIKPSQEAIDMFLSTGEKVLDRVKKKLNEIGSEDLYYALLTPSQAALMTYGVAPPTPRETVELMRDIFVKKEKMLEDSYVDTLEQAIKIRKELEHEEKSNVSGKEIDELLEKAEDYLKRINKLFEQIQVRKEKENRESMIDGIIALTRNLIIEESEKKKIEDSELLELFDEYFIKTSKLPPSAYKDLKFILSTKNKKGNLNKADSQKLDNKIRSFYKIATEQLQRTRLRKIESKRIRIRYGKDKIGFIALSEDKIFLNKDISNSDEIFALSYSDDLIGSKKKVSLDEMEKNLVESRKPLVLNQKIIELIEKEFGKDFEIIFE
ncbi:MAG: hypothetical protein PWQ87_709 [Candidatus Woesearchaeota archaeon]|nr:hypothetical protein [Candidatus Woesearchaeota archaeon]